MLTTTTHRLVGWLMLLAPALDRLYGEASDDMMMIGHEMRELPDLHLPTLFERNGEILQCSIDTNTPSLFKLTGGHPSNRNIDAYKCNWWQTEICYLLNYLNNNTHESINIHVKEKDVSLWFNKGWCIFRYKLKVKGRKIVLFILCRLR